MNILKKYWPILALAIAVWAILIYVKPTVYNIPVPKQFFVTTLFQESDGFEISEPEAKKWDSITHSVGFQSKELPSGFVLYELNQSQFPLQWIGFWKDGFKYTQVLVRRTRVESDTTPNIGLEVLNKLGYHEDSTFGMFLENYEGSEIRLRLEKKKPAKIVALWENFAITGETDGEQIKLNIPAAATKMSPTLIRVWCAYPDLVSPVCEVPVVAGRVATRFSQVSSLRPDGRFTEIKPMLQNLYGGELGNKITSALADLAENNELKLALAFGDIRIMKMDTYGAVVFNYFGKKIFVVVNKKSEKNALALPFKGDLKHTYNNTVFTPKGGKIHMELPPNGFEILY